MESFFSRYRNLLVLLVVLVAQMVGLAVQVRRTNNGRNSLDPGDGPSVRLLRLWANALVTPPERLFHDSRSGTSGVWQNYLDLRHVREQNQDLEKTIDRLRLEQASLLEDARQGQRLQTLLGFQEKYIYKTVVAQAIGSSGNDQSRVFYIDKGSAEGLDRDMAVITPDGIVGKVREVFPHTAQVLAIHDQTSGAGVILETTRIRGILRGNAAGQPQIVGILADQRIQPGEKVLTAGGDQIFPRGLPVGVVEKVVRDPDRDSFIDVVVKPAAHLDRLDEVLVITSTLPRFSDQQQQDLATSEEQKGAEAKAIEEQKKASEIMAERLPGLKDPNAPAATPAAAPGSSPGQPGQTPATPTAPAPTKVLSPQHSDRYTPGAAEAPAPPPPPVDKFSPKARAEAADKAKPSTPTDGSKPRQGKPASPKPGSKPTQPANPRRNP
jgi:rod shape-determining protein MreC